jgi:hypothetical protein
MASKKNSEEVFTHRVRPDGDGRYFVGAKYNEDGEEVEVVTGRHVTEPDAEKELRAIVSGNDVIAVERIHSVNKDDNGNVVFESPSPEESKKFGMTVKYKTSEERPTSDDQPTPADKAVEEGKVAPLAAEVEPTEAELKAREAAAKKAEEAAKKEEEAAK